MSEHITYYSTEEDREELEHEDAEDVMTVDKLIEICNREYERGLHTAKSSKFDEGYAYAMKICLFLAQDLKKNLENNNREEEILICCQEHTDR